MLRSSDPQSILVARRYRERRTILTSDDEDELLVLVLLLGGILERVDKLATIGVFVPAVGIVSR